MPAHLSSWLLAVALALAGLSNGGTQAVDAPSNAAAPEPMGAAGGAKLKASRDRFVQAVKEGSLVGFDEAAGLVTFRPVKPIDTSHQPGPMEDEVIASAVRAGVVENATLRGLKVKVECQGGALRVADNNATAPQLAEIIQLALGVDGVREVSAELPRSLRLRPAA